jgi:DNA-directed RNA polymerase subunit RPC12/RpoP
MTRTQIVVMHDGPEENNVHYCHQCGGKVIYKERT